MEKTLWRTIRGIKARHRKYVMFIFNTHTHTHTERAQKKILKDHIRNRYQWIIQERQKHQGKGGMCIDFSLCGFSIFEFCTFTSNTYFRIISSSTRERLLSVSNNVQPSWQSSMFNCMEELKEFNCMEALQRVRTKSLTRCK